jgi:hypothetical protein
MSFYLPLEILALHQIRDLVIVIVTAFVCRL